MARGESALHSFIHQGFAAQPSAGPGPGTGCGRGHDGTTPALGEPASEGKMDDKWEKWERQSVCGQDVSAKGGRNGRVGGSQV